MIAAGDIVAERLRAQETKKYSACSGNIFQGEDLQKGEAEMLRRETAGELAGGGERGGEENGAGVAGGKMSGIVGGKLRELLFDFGLDGASKFL